MKILVISPKNKTIINFRGDLIKDMISNGNDVYVIGPNKEFEEDIINLGVSAFYEVPLVKDNTSILGDLSYLRNLIDIIKQVQPELVFQYTIKPVIYGSIAARICGIKKIYPMITGLGRVYASKNIKTKFIRIVTKTLYKIAFKNCKKVIFQNKDDVNEFVSKKYLHSDKCVIVNGSGVNMTRFYKSELPTEPVFLMVSRIIKEKGVLDFALAAREVKKKIPNARFIVLGGYDTSIGALKKEDLKEFVDDGSIELLGEVKDPVSYYCQSSVFVLPSYYREGLPRTILEGMACGRPVITTDWTGCREPIIDGVNGFLIPIKRPDILADKMYELADDTSKLSKMANAAYVICKEKFEVGIVNQQMREIIGY